jgi:hypothetical protein
LGVGFALSLTTLVSPMEKQNDNLELAPRDRLCDALDCLCAVDRSVDGRVEAQGALG